MDRITRQDLQRLVAHEAPLKLSIYMPTYRAGREVRQNPIRFKNLLKQAGSLLSQHDVADSKTYLKSALALENDSDWWQHQADGLALFLSQDEFSYFRLPADFEERCIVGPRFHLAPLASLVQDNGRFYMLAVSKNRVRLFEGSKFSVSELEPEGLPKNLRSALNIDEYMTSLQHHSAGVGRGDAGGQGLFHGHGGSDLDVQKQDEILQFFRRVDSALEEYFHQERTPLLFAGVEYLFPLFQEACDYRTLLPEPLTGNPDQASADELHRRAWPLVQPHFDASRKQAVERYVDAAPDRTTSDILELVRAAREGQVDTLLYADAARVYGTLGDQSTGAKLCSEDDPEAEDLVNAAAVATLANSGQVFSMPREQMPRGETVAATLRYPLAST
ncbi:MAG: hypothetical protein DWQ37_03090 [Planctomycetota bacterium]|nr:MAG: hypothetical protein DWQ37_03090 [Planctomycetota bacterium]